MKKAPLRNLELEIGAVLRAGVVLSTAIVVFGGVLYLMRHASATVDYHQFRSEPDVLRSPASVASYAMHGNSMAMIQLGLIALIATPVVRVALSAGVFVRQKDWMYAGFTAIVLALLAYGLFG